MKNLLLLIIIGFAGYGGYTLWNERYGDPQRAAAQAEAVATGQGKEALPKKSANPEETAKDAVNDIVSYTTSNLGQILSPIRTQGSQPTIGSITPLKVKLLSESRKPHSARSTARLQLALQLTGTLEQAINHRAERVQQIQYNDGMIGVYSEKTKDFRLSNEEERKRLQLIEWRKRGSEQQWNDSARDYRTTIEKLLVSLASYPPS